MKMMSSHLHISFYSFESNPSTTDEDKFILVDPIDILSQCHYPERIDWYTDASRNDCSGRERGDLLRSVSLLHSFPVLLSSNKRLTAERPQLRVSYSSSLSPKYDRWELSGSRLPIRLVIRKECSFKWYSSVRINQIDLTKKKRRKKCSFLFNQTRHFWSNGNITATFLSNFSLHRDQQHHCTHDFSLRDSFLLIFQDSDLRFFLSSTLGLNIEKAAWMSRIDQKMAEIAQISAKFQFWSLFIALGPYFASHSVKS